MSAAIVEALERGGVLDEAKVLYIRAASEYDRLEAVDIWAPDLEAEPPSTTWGYSDDPPPIPTEAIIDPPPGDEPTGG